MRRWSEQRWVRVPAISIGSPAVNISNEAGSAGTLFLVVKFLRGINGNILLFGGTNADPAVGCYM